MGGEKWLIVSFTPVDPQSQDASNAESPYVHPAGKLQKKEFFAVMNVQKLQRFMRKE